MFRSLFTFFPRRKRMRFKSPTSAPSFLSLQQIYEQYPGGDLVVSMKGCAAGGHFYVPRPVRNGESTLLGLDGAWEGKLFPVSWTLRQFTIVGLGLCVSLPNPVTGGCGN